MIIGADACCWSNRRGFGRFARELLRALWAEDGQNEYLLFADRQTEAVVDISNADINADRVRIVSVNTSEAPTQAASADGRRSIPDLLRMNRAVAKHPVDLFFFPTVYSYFPISNRRAKIVLTVCDAIADSLPELIFSNWKNQLFWRMKQTLAIRQADMIITISQHAKQQIVETLNVPEHRIRVVSVGPSSAFRVLPRAERDSEVLSRCGLGADEPFLLYVGGISPHKNLGTMLDAYSQLRKEPEHQNVRLVLAGDYETDSFYSSYGELRRRIKDLGLEERVVFTGFIEDQDLAILYNRAVLLLFPSLMEGFGLPALEAMACGTPVVSSNRASLPEVLGGAGALFDPQSVDEMVTTVKGVLSDQERRACMSKLGLERAAGYSWEIGARQTLELFNELVAR